MINVLIADDHSVVREGVRHLIESEPDINICAEASDGQEVLGDGAPPRIMDAPNSRDPNAGSSRYAQALKIARSCGPST